MFTGIVEVRGSVVEVHKQGESARLVVLAPALLSDVGIGDSIAVNGVCLTVVEHDGEQFAADVMQVSLDRSTLGELRPGDPVNLERAATLQTRLGGHLVQGHVDATVQVLSRTDAAGWRVLRLSLPADLARYLVAKGSVCLDGTSLTVSALGPDWFEVSLIPETLRTTTFGNREPGDRLNLEVDVIAKHVERLLAGRSG